MDNDDYYTPRPTNSQKVKSGIHALLNNEEVVVNQDVNPFPEEPAYPRAQNFPPYTSQTNNLAVDPNEVINRVSQLSIHTPKTKSPGMNSPYDSSSSRCHSPNSNMSASTGNLGSYSPYPINSSGPASRDEMGPSNRYQNLPQDKRQRRLIRNRLAAQESRQKKKVYVSDLEEKVRKLEMENFKLHHDIHKLNEQLETGYILDEPIEGSNNAQVFPLHHQPLLPPTSKNALQIPQHLLPSRPSSTPPALSQQLSTNSIHPEPSNLNHRH